MMAVFLPAQILSSLWELNLRKMEVISTKKFILFALATVVFLTSNGMCLDEPMKSSLQNTEDYDDKYYEVRSALPRHYLGELWVRSWALRTFLPKALLISLHSIQHYSTSSLKESLLKECSGNSSAQTDVLCKSIHVPIFLQYSPAIRLRPLLKCFLLTRWGLNQHSCQALYARNITFIINPKLIQACL